jgi:hypothetical protein
MSVPAIRRRRLSGPETQLGQALGHGHAADADRVPGRACLRERVLEGEAGAGRTADGRPAGVRFGQRGRERDARAVGRRGGAGRVRQTQRWGNGEAGAGLADVLDGRATKLPAFAIARVSRASPNTLTCCKSPLDSLNRCAIASE